VDIAELTDAPAPAPLDLVLTNSDGPSWLRGEHLKYAANLFDIL